MNILKSLIVSGCLALGAGAAGAATVNPDDFLGSADLGNSGDVAEVAALCDILEGDSDNVCGLDLEIDEKFESGLTIMQDDVDDSVFYVSVAPSTPGWFILKFGTGQSGYDSHYFFENIDDLTILAWDVDDDPGLAGLWNCVEGDEVGDDCKLSHITTVIPLPAAGWLLLGGLGGLVAIRRRYT